MLKNVFRVSGAVKIAAAAAENRAILVQPQSGAKKPQKQAEGGALDKALLGHIPSTAGTFRKKFWKNSGKTPETLSERFLEFPSRVRLGSPKHYNSRHLEAPEHFQNCLPPQYGWGRLFFKKWFRNPERASQSRSWNSQQYWGYF